MKIKAYFLFPEVDDDFVTLGDDPQAYKDLISEIASIKQQLRKNIDFELYYNSLNTDLFLKKVESLIQDEYLADCRKQLNILFGNFSTNVNANVSTMTDCFYAFWCIDCIIMTADALTSEAAESKLKEGDYKTVVINLAEAYKTNRNCLFVIKDAIHYDHLPQLATIPIVKNDIEFSEWVSNQTNQNFSLRDRVLFLPTAFRWKKQAIFKKIDTGEFWYYDYFHKENKQHYEVFDSTGIHSGEANIEGVLDKSKADGDKRIDHIIHGD